MIFFGILSPVTVREKEGGSRNPRFQNKPPDRSVTNVAEPSDVSDIVFDAN